MSEAPDLKARHKQVLAIAERTLDGPTLAIIRSALDADQRMAVIRDAFIEGRDHEAVHLIRELDPIGPRALLPMSSTWDDIAFGQTAQITARPQLPFLPTHLLVSSRCRDFMINDIKVGNRSHFVQAGDVPADLFVVEAPELEAVMATPDNADDTKPVFAITVNTKVGRAGIALDLPIVQVGWDVVLTVTNTGVGPIQFLACWLGQVRWTHVPPAMRPERAGLSAADHQQLVAGWQQAAAIAAFADDPVPPEPPPPPGGDQEP